MVPPRVDIHQHLWTEPLVHALAARHELPFIRHEHGLTVLYLVGEQPYVVDLSFEAPAHRAALVASDGLNRALLCLSSPLGIEWLPPAQSRALIGAYHDGALSLRDPFGVWGAIPIDDPDPLDVERALARGCIGFSLPAGALAGIEQLARMRPVLTQLETLDAPLFIHPGPGPRAGGGGTAAVSLAEPLWWPALTSYVAGMQAAWLAFLAAGRSAHPNLRVIFAMLAGLAPLHGERLSARGGPHARLRDDPLVFYDTSSYGPAAIRSVARVVGERQLLYGSDRPVVEPAAHGVAELLDWHAVAESTQRAFGSSLDVLAA